MSLANTSGWRGAMAEQISIGYCTANTEAHVGKEPVYVSNRVELIALMGIPAYNVLAEHCAGRMEAIALTRAEQKKRELPLFIIHPATVAAGR